MFIDDLPLKGFIGEVEETSHKYNQHVHNETRYYLFTHLDFSIAYHDSNVIACNLTTDPQQRIQLEYGKDIEVEFSYSVRWSYTPNLYVDRMTVHSQSAIADQAIEIHWLNIINSFALVLLLSGFLTIIMARALKNDIARKVTGLEDPNMQEEELADESGWKLISGDVFRFPRLTMLLSASVGVGIQMLVLMVLILALALIGSFYPGNRGALYSAAVLGYALTAGIAGYVATRLYLQLGGQRWAMSALLTAGLFAVPFLCTFSIINSVAWGYGSASYVPFKFALLIFALWSVVSMPLTIFGSLRARDHNQNRVLEAPCKTHKAEREIPPVAWYRSLPVQLFIAGFLPFSAIYVELHYIFAAVWGHHVYTLFGILALVFVMLLTVTASITVALVYFQLAGEDYHWWWRSFLSGCSTGVFMLVYSAHYYVYRSDMYGHLQAVFFFGYTAMVSLSFSLMLGAVSFLTALTFVKYIYTAIKID